MNILYITYDGLTDPLGQSQVIPYVKGLSNTGFTITILSYEKKDNYRKFKEEISKQLADNNIQWKPMKYHARFSVLSTGFDLLNGIFAVRKIIKDEGIRIVHCRSYVSAFLGLMLKKRHGVKFIFDMRGFWVDERRDAGMLQSKFLYSRLKKFEKMFLLNADSIISLTEAAVKEMKSWPYITERDISKCTQIATCCDVLGYESAFKLNIARSANSNGYKLVYVGSIGPWHSLEDLCRFMRITYQHLPNSSFKLIVNQGAEHLHAFIEENQLDKQRFSIENIPHDKIPNALANCDIGFFFIPPKYAKKASSPTKMGEMLSAGLPIITSHSIGDVDHLVESNNIGHVIKSFDDKSIKEALDRVTALLDSDRSAISQRCLAIANSHFSLEKAVVKYADIYSKLNN